MLNALTLFSNRHNMMKIKGNALTNPRTGLNQHLQGRPIASADIDEGVNPVQTTTDDLCYTTVEESIVPLIDKRRDIPVESRSLTSRKRSYLGCPQDGEYSCRRIRVEDSA
ncbi:hypothetical protein L484_014328 [Morus notabilis]|uniref:Uncharacterized protein n=1 Tax=Morus notabilis TaxID=981085 RepID=W9S9T1_9ROSA|nr:hypothetical protein L484_014328 [Morus notabilis]